MNRKTGFRRVLFLVLLLTACNHNMGQDTASTQEMSATASTQQVVDEDRSGCVVSSVPPVLSFDPFYEKYCDADGIPVISSPRISDLALKQAYYIIMNMLKPIPEVRRELIANGAYFAVIGKLERLTSLPEYAHMDSEYWDKRARGLGGSRESPVTSSAEENLLCRTWDRYYGESIAVHEFAHTISLMGLGVRFDALYKEFSFLYKTALQSGLWANTYAGSDIQEYWAEGVQSYFNTNLEATPTDGVHNYVNTRQELEEYDPALYDFISRFFHGYQWTPICP